MAGEDERSRGREICKISVNGKTGDVILMAKHVGAPSINDLRAYASKGEPAGQYTPTFLNEVGTYKQVKSKGFATTRINSATSTFMALAQGLKLSLAHLYSTSRLGFVQAV
ncbi:hypothetical protein P7H17_00075 [Paenibacillus larvae]|nr:hypothetical protein [Paenibacillus larvae]MDT2284839.1 hypothetical protein [Paenibacillus larvae]